MRDSFLPEHIGFGPGADWAAGVEDLPGPDQQVPDEAPAPVEEEPTMGIRLADVTVVPDQDCFPQGSSRCFKCDWTVGLEEALSVPDLALRMGEHTRATGHVSYALVTGIDVTVSLDTEKK
ncbi:hypothetical protein ACFRMQ_37275 [Kitasatospora sp. NPDC056783]|uniref:hypothetical protein n=1 Tax=Kitasatospora sp. NPDC056783 TaxID=3345943 RepID=UPI0036ADE8B7